MNKLYLSSILLCLFVAGACGKMDDNLKKYAGEVVYPGKFDTIIGLIGYERLEIELAKAGRIPASQMKLGKATKTIVEFNGETKTIDTLASWLSFTDLTESRLYRIKVYTMDDNGNKSVPLEIALIPYLESDKEMLSVNAPRITSTPDAVAISWPTGLSSTILDYYALTYNYKDKDGITHAGEAGANPIIIMENLQSGSSTNIDIRYKVVPRVNGTPILDTVEIEQTISISVPEKTDSYIGKERSLGAIISASKENDGGPGSKEGSTKLIDFDNNSKFFVGGYTSAFWIQQELYTQYVVNSYVLVSANDAEGRDPKSWQLQGSNNGTQWTTLDSRTNETFSKRFMERVFNFTNTQAYKFYRISITENNGDSNFQLAEWRLLMYY